MAEPNREAPGLLANILAVAGFIILIVIIVWGAYHLLRLTGSGISSIYSRFSTTEKITVSAPTSAVQSNKAFPLSWKYAPQENGTYAFLYQCKSGFRFEATTPTGSTMTVPCGNAYTIGTASNVTLTPVLSGTSSVDVPISVIYMPSATTSNSRPQGTATIRVVAATDSAATNSTTAKPKPTTTTTSTNTSTGTSQPKVAGPADLSVRIIAVGIIDPVTNLFVNRPPMNPDEIGAVKFDIGNVGGTATGPWYFAAQLPTMPTYSYQSPVQMSLAPGGHIENTLRFRPVAANGGTVTVTVDTQNMVRESSEANNYASQWMQAPMWTGYSYPAPYVY